MKVLITGMTATQANPLSHQRSLNFAGLMQDQLTAQGVSVVWQDPVIGQDVSQYDRILIGLSSPLGLGSSKAYAALHLLGRLWFDPRVVIYLDGPDPNNIKRGIESVLRNPESLVKEFFSKRKDYALVKSNIVVRTQIYQVLDRLLWEEWPKTIVPAFPWTTQDAVLRELPEQVSGDKLHLVNLDSEILDKYETLTSSGFEVFSWNKWYFERGNNKAWLRKNKGAYPAYSLKGDYRQDLREYHVESLSRSTGLLHAPCRRDLIWWTPRVPIALSQATPVVTGSSSNALGSEWSITASVCEAVRETTRRGLAEGQKTLYVESISKLPTKVLEVL